VGHTDGSIRFLVAPASLVFHDVSDLKISIDFGIGGLRHNLNEPSISQITGQPVEITDREYYRWRMDLNEIRLIRRGQVMATKVFNAKFLGLGARDLQRPGCKRSRPRPSKRHWQRPPIVSSFR
jgi:hypothetical protein